jgi:diacylglycerol kinase (ATP)
MRVLLAVNIRARRGRGALERATAALVAHGHDVIEAPMVPGSDLSATIEAHRGKFDIVAIGGGDGTLISAIAGIRATGVRLAIIPLGTINELARTLGIPLDIEPACALIDAGREHAIDVGYVNGVPFFNEASIGLSTHVVREQTGEIKSRWGMFAIPIATLRSLGAMRPYHLDITNDAGDTNRFRTMQLTIANSSRFGGVVENPTATIDDGLLDLYSIELVNWWDALVVVGAVATKRFPRAHGVQTMRSPRFKVESKHTHRVFADGEPATQTPAEFTIAPGAITVFVPQ